MFKKTTYPNPAPKTSGRDRWLKVGIVGALLALTVSVTPLFGSQADAVGGATGACIQAEFDSGKYTSLQGGCGGGDSQPVPSEVPTVPFAVICKHQNHSGIASTWAASPNQEQMYRVEVSSHDGEWKLVKSVPTAAYSADGRTVLALLGHGANGEDVGATYSGQLRVVYDIQGATRISKPIWFSVTTTALAPSVTC
jgi:hypothetical protein